MKKHILNPYKLNWKMYGLIGGISVLVMIFAVSWNNDTNNSISDVIKNLAFGCVASTLVALLIEIGNTKEKNEKANSIYNAVFWELQYQILDYVKTWSRLCSVAFKDKNYREEKHTWMEWYEITKSEFGKCDENRQRELIKFFIEQLLNGVNEVEKEIKRIDTQKYLLNINNIYDKNLENILLDYKFEFYAAELTLEEPYDKEHFWNSFDAIKQDLINYIDNWIDISYYNYYKFKPNNFNDDKTEIVNAIIISQQNAKNFQNRTYARK